MQTNPSEASEFLRAGVENCLFCQVIADAVPAILVFENEVCLGFLDHRPLFPGHSLLVPRQHYETLGDLPSGLVGPFFSSVQLMARAVEKALNAEGTFVAMNNRVSQSVPHLHVHIVPRRKKDGLKGFFWPRNKYESEEEKLTVQEAIRLAIRALTTPEGNPQL